MLELGTHEKPPENRRLFCVDRSKQWISADFQLKFSNPVSVDLLKRNQAVSALAVFCSGFNLLARKSS
jgi:hypothetical protein